MNEADKERFFSKITPVTESGCYLWTASVDKDGYGQFGVDGKMKKAHRVSYEIEYGSIPEGLNILHKCDTAACTNPVHLYAGTHQDNIRDRTVRRREPYGKDHWKCKLTFEQVNEIRKDNRPTKEIANDYNISDGYVYDLKNFKKENFVERMINERPAQANPKTLHPPCLKPWTTKSRSGL